MVVNNSRSTRYFSSSLKNTILKIVSDMAIWSVRYLGTLCRRGYFAITSINTNSYLHNSRHN
jgi:hypothetical protein